MGGGNFGMKLKYVKFATFTPLIEPLARKVFTDEEMEKARKFNGELWVAYNSKPIGFILFNLQNGVPESVHINGCYIDPHYKEAGKGLLEKVTDYAREHNRKNITARTKRPAKGFIRKYGFKELSINLIKEI